MKFATIIVLASATYTMAGNCSRGLSYCGRSLLHIGNYANQIEAAIQKAHTNPSHMLDTLFYCLGRDNGNRTAGQADALTQGQRRAIFACHLRAST
ncbi:hypothetical protein B0H14DRAFT_3446076 [Mycena olivaceomarginata]|nr:hypothetical protein B0H14DRAFT_3446076 [Mycena olivaceomarginata]